MAELKAQPWEQWRPPGPGPMQVLGELDHGAFARLADDGWTWSTHEEEWDEFPEGTMVLLLERGGTSRFMLEAVPYAPEIGVRIWGPGTEERERLAAEVLEGLGLAGEPLTLDATWPDDEEDPDEDRADLLALVAAAEQAPFPLFGLTDAFRGPRDLNGVGRRGEAVNHVGLSHGLWSRSRIDVAVTGPLHGSASDGAWSTDPLPMIAAELLNRTGRRVTAGEELIEACDEILARGFEHGEVRVDGEPRPFRFLRDGAHWAALHDLPGGHLLYVVASNVEPSELELTRLDNLAAYA